MATKQQNRQQTKQEKHHKRRKLRRLVLLRQKLIRRWKLRPKRWTRLLPWKQGAPVHTAKQLLMGEISRRKRLEAKNANPT